MPGFWALLGLTAVVGGVMRSPLTGVIFTLELTNAWAVALPLLIASVVAYGASVLFLRRSVLTEKIARRGLHLTRDYTADPLETFFCGDAARTEGPPRIGPSVCVWWCDDAAAIMKTKAIMMPTAPKIVAFVVLAAVEMLKGSRSAEHSNGGLLLEW
nr:chloride channel protein [Arthrobacter sp. efr-133-R2A-63]